MVQHGKSLISFFQEFLGINETFILAGDLAAGVSVSGV